MTLESVGKYKILGEIGEGAMGVVYKAHDPFLNRYVAIKMISASLKADNELRERFQREAQAAASLNHPNIVTVHDFGEEQGKIYMAMELLEGSDLRDVIGNPTQRRIEDKISIMEQVCDGLAFAHAKTIVHRDLKPGNIHILPNGTVKIMDFGLARLGSSDMTATGLVMGTPNYMSPEQVMGERVDVRSDVFSLGAVFYELLTARKPFEADSVHGVLYRVVHKEPPPVRNYAPSVPPSLIQVVEKALRKDKNHRFQNAGEMREALGEVRQIIAGGRAADESTLHEMLELEAVEDTEAAVVEEEGPSHWVEGSAALDAEPKTGLEATQAVAGTATRPVGSSGRPAPRAVTRRPARPAPAVSGVHSRLPLYFGGAAALAALAMLAVVAFRRPPEQPRDMSTEVGALTRGLVRTQLTLASRYLDDKDYPKAISQAQETLQLDPSNVAVKRLLDDARQKQGDLDAAATEARTAFDAGENDKAAAALGRLNELNPNHPVAKELSPKLNKFFRSQAEDAKRAMERSRDQAKGASAQNVDTFATALGLARDAEARFAKQEFGEAYRGFLESRDAFDRARRSAEARVIEERVRTVQNPTPPQSIVTAPSPTQQVAPPPPTTQPVVTPPPPTQPIVPGRGFRAGATSSIGPVKKGVKVPKGFEPPRDTAHPAALQFEVTPPEVKPGDSYTVKVFLLNNGDAPIKIKGVTANARVNGGRATPVSGSALASQVGPHEKGLVFEVPGQWPEGVNTWRLDVVIDSDRGDEYKSLLTLS
ncbi:MAG TPA: protein kinase [Vicinamibacteria bacterium]